MTAPTQENRRILVIDDTESIHQDFQKTLGRTETSAVQELEESDAELFGEINDRTVRQEFDLDFATQGQQGFEIAKAAIAEGKPHAVAFVDMRMPPGWDGLETIEHLWKETQDLQTVICTAYSDHSWSEIVRRLGQSNNLLILKKPFDKIELVQLACALTEKWLLTKQARMREEELEARVERQVQDITVTRDIALQALSSFRGNWSQELLGEAYQTLELLEHAGKAADKRRQATSTGGAQNRNAERHQYIKELTAFIVGMTDKTENPLIKIVAKDVSSGGISFLFYREIVQNELVVFLEKGGSVPVWCKSEIIRRKSIGNGLWEYGVKFSRKSEATA